MHGSRCGILKRNLEKGRPALLLPAPPTAFLAFPSAPTAAPLLSAAPTAALAAAATGESALTKRAKVSLR